MARITEHDILAILDQGTDVDSTVDLSMMVTLATEYYDGVFDSGDHSTALAKEIERLLGAHFTASTLEPQANREKLGPAEQTLMAKQGMRLEATTYGQQALIADHTGKLAQAQEAKRGFEVYCVEIPTE